MKKRVLLTALLASASLAACHRQVDRVDYVRETPNHAVQHNNARTRNGVRHHAHRNNTNKNQTSRNRTNKSNSHRYDVDRNGDRIVDTHHEYVTSLGFTNVVNSNGHTYHNRYRLNREYAARPEIFEGWRHTWVEPHEFMDKDIDIYRYTGEYNGEIRTVYIMSHNGRVLGGYHHGEGEDIRNARILQEGTYTSRLGEDFRNTWDDLFSIRQ